MKKIIFFIFVINLLIINSLLSQLSINNIIKTAETPIKPVGIQNTQLVPPLSINTQNTPLISSIPKIKSLKSHSLSDILTPSDTFNHRRFWFLVGTGSAVYISTIALLNNVWYAQYPRSSFHFFDDEGEWMQMDKGGHLISAYQSSKWVYSAMRWSGMKNRNAAWFGMAVGTTFQATIETLDGFSTKWGFSWSDIAANSAGCALFGLQQAAWNEQRIVIKVSNTPRIYPLTSIPSIDGSNTTTIRERTNKLYGSNYTQTFFKDYNALIFWLSVNPKSFNKDSHLPDWLNVAVGYGADNMYGGYKNEWPDATPEYRLSDTTYPRYRQYYLSLDIDLSRIKTKSKLIKALARTFNFIKIPSPTLEFNSLGKVRFHPLLF